ncbi:hypothetical protein LCGC14_0889810 [marine sediment metagenome]|uniref:Uncharacterized protein n=1 Tax=marine sediment metagenome TaxID=412755 RepID=A0A0F9S6J6_9ZZZZ
MRIPPWVRPERVRLAVIISALYPVWLGLGLLVKDRICG